MSRPCGASPAHLPSQHARLTEHVWRRVASEQSACGGRRVATREVERGDAELGRAAPGAGYHAVVSRHWPDALERVPVHGAGIACATNGGAIGLLLADCERRVFANLLLISRAARMLSQV
jgi:hypothetical protein